MKIWHYLNYDKLQKYVEDGYVNMNLHKQFPLAIFTYGRKTVRDHLWDDVTEKCRGLIVHLDSGTILARPFEKFFNYEQSDRPETHLSNLPSIEPMILDKIYGSLGIVYRWQGVDYVASKRSFHSVHAKWMTNTYKNICQNAQWPAGYTPVLEMVCESIQHHVVHYGKDSLFLLALINIETGEEVDYNTLYHWAQINGLPVPAIYNITLRDATKLNEHNREGFVATWLRLGQTPLRIKIKMIDFLRLQKMLHHVQPKHILEALSQPHLRSYLDEWLNNSTPEFAKFVRNWRKRLEDEYQRHFQAAHRIFTLTQLKVGWPSTRKDYALEFTQAKNRPYAPVLFAMLDRYGVQKEIWKLVKPITQGERSMCNEEDEEVRWCP